MTESNPLDGHRFDHGQNARFYRDAGVREASVWRNGQDVTDTVPPTDWPEPWRNYFFVLNWRPWTPPGVTPIWHEYADGEYEASATPGELALEARVNIAALFKNPWKGF